ncbi:MAG: hypothetical protein JWN70_1664 [Planctomycetaceae bacterium]|nr:hypothetical protein [Planctomycetaceae bacterium]
MIDPNTVQHVNVKVFLKEPQALNLADVVPIFHRWIREGFLQEMLVDVADYRHVEAGPGVLLIGHEANYSLDNRENRLGLLYNRKASLDGTFQERLSQAYRAAIAACDRLEQEDIFRGILKFDRDTLDVFVNDRLLAPNTEESWQGLRGELEAFFQGFAIERQGEPRDLFRVAVTRR